MGAIKTCCKNRGYKLLKRPPSANVAAGTDA